MLFFLLFMFSWKAPPNKERNEISAAGSVALMIRRIRKRKYCNIKLDFKFPNVIGVVCVACCSSLPSPRSLEDKVCRSKFPHHIMNIKLTKVMLKTKYCACSFTLIEHSLPTTFYFAHLLRLDLWMCRAK